MKVVVFGYAPDMTIIGYLRNAEIIYRYIYIFFTVLSFGQKLFCFVSCSFINTKCSRSGKCYNKLQQSVLM